jgi:hypothetical protein
MLTITNFQCVDDKGQTVPCDAFGNNVAFSCPLCSHPMLAIIRNSQRGSYAGNPAVCRSCQFRCWLSNDQPARLLRLYPLH